MITEDELASWEKQCRESPVYKMNMAGLRLIAEVRALRKVAEAAEKIKDPKDPRRPVTWTPTPEHYDLYKALKSWGGGGE